MLRIAFDLDNTLIRNEYDFPLEMPVRKYWSRLLPFEFLRDGVSEIFRFCKEHKIQVWVYTSSYRSPLYIKTNFWLYDIRLDGVVNQEIHNKRVKVKSTKYPPAFGIDVLIDDSEYVSAEGKRLGYDTLLIDPQNTLWVKEVTSRLRSMMVHAEIH